MRRISENVLSQLHKVRNLVDRKVLNVEFYLNLEKPIFELYSLGLFHMDAYHTRPYRPYRTRVFLARSLTGMNLISVN